MIKLPTYLELAKITYHGMCEQEREGICFDSGTAHELIQDLTQKMEAIEQDIEPELPKREPLKSELSKMTPPKLQFKKDGTPSAKCLEWFDDVCRTDESGHIVPDHDEQGYWMGKKGDTWVQLPYHKPIITEQTMTLSNGTQIKDWLLSLGWSPLFWNFKQKKNKHGKMEKVRENGKLVKSSPKIQENGKICPNLEAMSDKIEIIRPYLLWLTYRHRRSQIQGWLDNPRLQIDGRLGASSSGLTNTKRQKHVTVVNVPRVGSVYGQEMRSLFIPEKGKVLVGYDASSLEDRVKAHYLYKIDGGVLAAKVAAGEYDPHQESADVWGMPRSRAKNGNYALQYLCQPPTLAKTLGCSVQEAEMYHAAYWELNSALAEFVNQVTRSWVQNNKKFVRTIDHSKIYTRAEHSVANAVMQSTGAKIMDLSYAILRKDLTKTKINATRVLYQHDEYQWEVEESAAEEFGYMGVQSVIKAGEFFRLNCPMDAEFSIGRSWAETH